MRYIASDVTQPSCFHICHVREAYLKHHQRMFYTNMTKHRDGRFALRKSPLESSNDNYCLQLLRSVFTNQLINFDELFVSAQKHLPIMTIEYTAKL